MDESDAFRFARRPTIKSTQLRCAVIFYGVEHEKRIIGEVALKEAARFHRQAVSPFEAEFLEKGGGLFHLTGVESEGGTDAEIDSRREEVFVFRYPVFLFRAAEADPDEVCARGAYF